MSYSKLATKYIPADTSNYTSGRGGKDICKITVHHMAGKLTGEQCGIIFQNSIRNASANYCIGYNGDIVCSVEEENRAWTSASYSNDCQAITIEVSNSATTTDWPIPESAFEALVALCTDICTRYEFKLEYTGDANGSLTRHNMFANTTCPGPTLQGRFEELAEKVNANLGEETVVETPVIEATETYKVGDTVKTTKLSTASNGGTVYTGTWSGTITKVITGALYPYLLNAGTGWTSDAGITNTSESTSSSSSASSSTFATIKAGGSVKLTSAKLYSSSGATSASATLTGTYYYWDSTITNGRVRITNKSSSAGASGQITGWIDSDTGSAAVTTTTTSSTSSSSTFKVGDSVQFVKAVDYNGTSLSVSGTYSVMQVSGDRIVVGKNNVITAAVLSSNLKKV